MLSIVRAMCVLLYYTCIFKFFINLCRWQFIHMHDILFMYSLVQKTRISNDLFIASFYSFQYKTLKTMVSMVTITLRHVNI